MSNRTANTSPLHSLEPKPRLGTRLAVAAATVAVTLSGLAVSEAPALAASVPTVTIGVQYDVMQMDHETTDYLIYDAPDETSYFHGGWYGGGNHYGPEDKPHPRIAGTLPTVQITGTRPLYECEHWGNRLVEPSTGMKAWKRDTYSSLTANCERAGDKLVRNPLAYIYTNPPGGGMPSALAYRCVDDVNGELFDTFDSNCEGIGKLDGSLGYIELRAKIGRYIANGDHMSSFLPASFWSALTFYKKEGDGGFIATTQLPGTVQIFECKTGGGDSFTSLDSACEGQQKLRDSGYIFSSPGSGVNQPLYRCVTKPGGEHFDSPDYNCEGHTREFRLGYIQALS